MRNTKVHRNDLEEVRRRQVNDKIIREVITELETIPRDKHFARQLCNDPALKRFKQIQAQLCIVDRVLVRNYQVQSKSDYFVPIFALQKRQNNPIRQKIRLFSITNKLFYTDLTTKISDKTK